MVGYMDPMMYNGQICSGNGDPTSPDAPVGFLLNGLTDVGGQNEATTAHNVWYAEMLNAERAGAAEIQEVTGVPTHFVEPPQAAQGHGYCAPADQRWTNTWDDSKQNVGNPTSTESAPDYVTTGVFHPNLAGYTQGMEPGLAAAVKEYSLPSASSSTPTADAELDLYWNAALNDNFTTATAQGRADAKSAGYVKYRVEGSCFSTQQTGTVPLNLYYNSTLHDNFTTATAQGAADAKSAGYYLVRVECYVYPTQAAGTVPLNLYYNSSLHDNFTTATAQGAADAKSAGYYLVRVEGYVFPAP